MASTLKQCHEAQEITIGFPVFVGLCSFEANGLFAERTGETAHTATPWEGLYGKF
jgi:hypothetical protein